MKLKSLATLCFIMLVSACDVQPTFMPATAFPTQVPAIPSLMPTNSSQPTNTLQPTQTATSQPTPAATDTPAPPRTTVSPTPSPASQCTPQLQEEGEMARTATMQTLIAALPPTATVIIQHNQAALPSLNIPQAWAALRAVLPADILVYMPTFVPERFGSPEVYDVTVSDEFFCVPDYTLGYYLHREDGDANTVVFILNNGKAGWGSVWAGPGLTKKAIIVDGESGELWMIPEQNPDPLRKPETFYWASWKKQDQYYQVKAISAQMNEAEFMQIVHSLVHLQK